MGTVQINPGSSKYDQYINSASAKYGVPVNLIKGVIKAESSGDPNARSSAGAVGLMQLMPKTASGLGVTNPYDPGQNIDGGTKYLAGLLKEFNGSVPLALAGYNAGDGAVKKYNGIPPYKETQDYVKKIMGDVGSGNVDISGLTTDGSTGSNNPLDIGTTIVNGFQNIFRTLFTDTTKMLIYIVLFGLMIFFGYKALQGSPPVNAGMKTGRSLAKTAVKLIK